MKTKTLVGLAIAGGLLYMAFVGPTKTDKRAQLIRDMQASPTDSQASKQKAINALSLMSAAEIDAVYEFIYNYVNKGRKLTQGSGLWLQIQAISTKYDIFT